MSIHNLFDFHQLLVSMRVTALQNYLLIDPNIKAEAIIIAW